MLIRQDCIEQESYPLLVAKMESDDEALKITVSIPQITNKGIFSLVGLLDERKLICLQ